jgi:hypothetical protein
MTQQLIQHHGVQEARQIMIERVRKGQVAAGTIGYSLGGMDGVVSFIKDYSTIVTAGRTGNLAVTYLGSYAGTIEVTNVTDHSATLVYHVENTSDLASATHLPFYGEIDKVCHCGDQWEAFVNSIPGSSGPLSPTKQDFYWSEDVSL